MQNTNHNYKKNTFVNLKHSEAHIISAKLTVTALKDKTKN